MERIQEGQPWVQRLLDAGFSTPVTATEEAQINPGRLDRYVNGGRALEAICWQQEIGFVQSRVPDVESDMILTL